MFRLLIIASLICIIDKTGFLCDERLKDLLYIRDEHEKDKTVEPSPKETEQENIEKTEEEKIEKKVEKKPKKAKKTKEQPKETVSVKPEELKVNSEPIADFGDLSDFGDFSGFEFRESGSAPVKDNENSINKDAIFGDFQEEDELPLLDNLDDIAASILSDIYGGVY